MTETTVSTPAPEIAPPGAVEEAPPKRRPNLTAELLELEKQLRADTPKEIIRYGVCAGTKQQPHAEEVWLTYLDPGCCPACAGPRRTWLLEPKGGKNG